MYYMYMAIANLCTIVEETVHDVHSTIEWNDTETEFDFIKI